MATTPNYSWVMPDPTDFVTDLPADFEIFGDAVDASLYALNPGTTAGDVDYYTSGTAKARLAIGTAGQVLTVNSGATAPEWAAPAAGGGLTLLSTTVAPGNTTSVEVTGISGSYKNLLIYCFDIAPASSATMSFQLGNTSTYYNAFGVTLRSGNVTFAGGAVNNAAVTSVGNMDNSQSSVLKVEVPLYARTDNNKQCDFNWSNNNGETTLGGAWFSGLGALAVTAFKLLSSQNVSGTILVYGEN
jgi:hypothetical protein